MTTEPIRKPMHIYQATVRILCPNTETGDLDEQERNFIFLSSREDLAARMAVHGFLRHCHEKYEPISISVSHLLVKTVSVLGDFQTQTGPAFYSWTHDSDVPLIDELQRLKKVLWRQSSRELHP